MATKKKKKKATRKTSGKKTGKKTTTRKKRKPSPRTGTGTDFTARMRDRFEDSVDEVRVQLDELEASFERAFHEVVERGRKTQKELSDRLKKARKDVEKAKVVQRMKDSELYENVKKFDAGKTARNVRKAADNTLRSGLESLQEVLDVPTRSEVDRLTKKVDQLQRKVRTLENRNGGAK